MRDDQSRLGELFDAARSVERAPSASRDEMRHAVAKQLMTAGVLATSATVAKGASAAAVSAGSSAAKLSSFTAGVSAKLALGIIAAATTFGGVGYVLHDRTQSRANLTHVRNASASARVWSFPHENAQLSERTRRTSAADTTPDATMDERRATPATTAADLTPNAATDTGHAELPRVAATDTGHIPPASAAAGVQERDIPRSAKSLTDKVESKQASPATISSKESLAEELALIRAAQSQLNARHAGEALSLLQRYFRSFPRGALVPEAQVARIRALCLSGRQAQAESEALRFVQSNPTSPLAARVRGGCAAQ